MLQVLSAALLSATAAAYIGCPMATNRSGTHVGLLADCRSVKELCSDSLVELVGLWQFITRDATVCNLQVRITFKCCSHR